jgi:putative peptide zinc metalloprotease protein
LAPAIPLEVVALSASQESARQQASGALFSDSWHRVADLGLRLRSHLAFHRHRYRGQLWYVLGDPSGDRYHRFTPRTHRLLQRLDGTRTVDEVWRDACEADGDEAPTQSEMIGLLSQLHNADALVGDESPDVQEVFKRYDTLKRRKFMGKIMSPLFMQFSLMDPERFLQRTIAKVRWVFGPVGLAIWLLVVGVGAALISVNFTELTTGFSDRVFAAQNLLVLGLVYPFVKVLHEFGHAYTVKRYGGEVHELGVMLMVLMPLPFVDASSASTFPSKRERIVVGAVGILVELFVAGLAAMVWVSVEEGLVRAVAYNVILIAGFSTLVFNGNPLLRYDGYYILSDLIEIPNLRQRSNAYLMWIGERYLFRNTNAVRPDGTRGEHRWFVGFGIASLIYRVIVLSGIIFLIASRFFFLGSAFALWSIITWVGLPLSRALTFLLVGPRLQAVRARALATSGLVALGLGLVLFALPMPSNTLVEGVLWIPDGSLVRANADGFVHEILARDGEMVTIGQALVVCKDPSLVAQRDSIAARLAELQARYTGARADDRVAAAELRVQITEGQAQLDAIEEQLSELTIVAPSDGQLVFSLAERYPGQFLQRGSPLGQVIDFADLRVRVVVPQDQADLVRRDSSKIRVRLINNPSQVVEAELLRQVPVGRERLPSSALGSFGGGDIVIDPRAESGDMALDPMFEFELGMIGAPQVPGAGARVYARFEHEWSPYGPRMVQTVRQLFLSRFDF